MASGTIKQKRFAKSRTEYFVIISLFLGSFLIYDYNLVGQPWHGDEITYLGWGGNYFQLIGKGDFSNPCLGSLDNCHTLFHIPAFGLTYSPLRNVLIGLPMFLTNHDNGNFYDWSCYWDCYNPHNGPTLEEMTAGRLLSPLFGSLTVVFSYLMGKMLFNKQIGLIASIIFLFYDMWMWYSRSIMVEVHYVFLVLLSLVLLIYSLKTASTKLAFFVPSAILFGFALNCKLLAVVFSGLFLYIILFKKLTREGRVQNGKKEIGTASILIITFFLLSLLGMLLVEPNFYHDPVNEIRLLKTDMDNYNRDVWYIGYPTTHNFQFNSLISIFNFLVFPSFLENQITNQSIDLWGNFGWTYPPTYSSIPMSLFFFIGFGFLIFRIFRSRIWLSSESLLIMWFASGLVLTLLIVKDFSLERYLLPLELSVLFIASYGVFVIMKKILNVKLKILFASIFIAVHSMTSLLYWGKIYLSPGTMWVNPLHYGTLQESLDNQFTFGANLLFLGLVLFILGLAFKRRLFGTPYRGDGTRFDLKR